MVDAGLGNFVHGQPEMTSQWCHVAVVHAGVKVCARHTGVRAGGPGQCNAGIWLWETICHKPILSYLMIRNFHM